MIAPLIRRMTQEINHAEQQAKAQAESVAEMVARLDHAQNCDCDYEQFVEDNELCDADVKFESEEEFDEYHAEYKAEQRIQDDALEVSVRSGWESSKDEFEAEDFIILLCTGGPAVRIRGELSDGQPDRAWLEYQDWGTPWTRFFDVEQDALLAYAQCFYFGE